MKRATLGAVLIAYAWVTSGVAPFSAPSYFLVGIPCLVFVVIYGLLGGLSNGGAISADIRGRSGESTLSTVAPWLALMTAVIVLEAVGLLLGGRSTSVPTLSTTVDHLLAVRWVRCWICLAWLLAGAFQLYQLRQLRRIRDS